MSHYDVIVIGSGAGGGTLVHRLAPSGQAGAAARARRLAAARAAELVGGGRLRRQPLRLARTPGTTTHGKPFQPQIHYFVGGATKLYGAALYRLREEDFGELDAPRRHLARVAGRLRRVRALLHAGRAALPGARRARRGPDRAARRARPTRTRPSATSRASSSSPTTSRPPGCTRSTRPAACMLDERDAPNSRCVRCATCDGFPCLVHAKSDAEVLAVRPALTHPQRDAAHPLAGAAAGDQRGRHGGHRRGRRARRRAGDVHRRRRRRLLRRRQLGRAAAVLGQRRAPARARERVRPGRAQLHVPQQPGRARALARSENPTIFQKTLGLNDFYFGADDFEFPLGQHPDGRQVLGRHVPRREAAADQARAAVDAATRSPATRSTSGSPPRTCRGRRTASRCATTAASQLAYQPTNQVPKERLLRRAEVAARARRPATSTTCSRATRTSRTRSRSPASPTRPGRAGSAPTRRRRCSTPTAARTRSTTSTSSTRASSRASAPSTRR